METVIGIDWKKIFLKNKILGNRCSFVIFFILSFLRTFNKIITNERNWEIIVAIPIPLTPKAGINKKPNIKIGFNIMFKRNYKTKTFL